MTHDDRPGDAAAVDRGAEWEPLRGLPAVDARRRIPTAAAYDVVVDPVHEIRRARVLAEHEQQRERVLARKKRGLFSSMRISTPSFDASVARVIHADRARRTDEARRLRDPGLALDGSLQAHAEQLIDRQSALDGDQRTDAGWAEFAGNRAFAGLYDAQFRTHEARTPFQAAEMKLMGASGGTGGALVGIMFIVGPGVLWWIAATLFVITSLAALGARRSNTNAAVEQSRNDLVWIEAVRRSVEHQYAGRVKDNRKKLAHRRESDARAAAAVDASSERESDGARAQRKATAAEVHEAYEHLQQEWGAYTLDREAFILTKPMLRVRAMPETRAYQDAMTALGDALDELGPDAPQHQIDAAAAISEHAWQAWHDANDAAEAIGVDDCTATERAALDRLSKLVERIAHPSTPAIERANIVRDIERCMKLITTAPVAWSDLRVLPELADALPALPAPAPVATTGHQTVGEERSESLTEPSFTNGATS